jgi:Ca2+-binding EF-hand superfamily protein
LIFHKFDLDKSGTVDFQEFIRGLSVITRGTPDEKMKGNNSASSRNAKLLAAFEMYDINGDGHISKEEFSRIVSSFVRLRGGSLTTFSGKTYTSIDDICNEVFGAMDLDNDGEISFDDYKQGALKNPDILKGLNIV